MQDHKMAAELVADIHLLNENRKMVSKHGVLLPSITFSSVDPLKGEYLTLST